MIVDPNKYKRIIPTICHMWDKAKDKPDFEYTITEISVCTMVHIVAVCIILEKVYKDNRIAPVRKRLALFHKCDSLELED